jgi:signal transduction histidine kinase
MAIFNHWKDLSISKKLYFVVGIMAILISAELITLRFAMHTLSAVRAFVGGEGTWSKSQKDAAFSLQRYVASGDEKDYQTFLNFLSVPEGDHRARLELLKADPDLGRVRQGFLDGKIHPDDIDPMVELLRRFHSISYLNRAIVAWASADGFLSEFKKEAESYHDLVKSGKYDRQRTLQILDRIRALNNSLTQVEGEFSASLGEGSRWLEGLVISALFMAVLMVETVGLTLTFVTSRMISRGLANLNSAAKKIGGGDFSQRLEVHSRDEIGLLTESVNKMGEILQASYQRLEQRVAERTEELSKLASENAHLYEEAKASAKAREDFFSIASHELRTPLTSMALQLELVGRAIKSVPSSPALLRVEELNEKTIVSADRLVKLIEKLLDLTRIRIGKFEVNREPCDLTSIVSESLSPLHPAIHFHSNGPILGLFDSIRLGQVVTNLASNALKYGGNKGVEIEIKSVENKAILNVKDQGPGIAPGQQEKIFEAFERKTVNKSISGLGLGLYITRQIVEAHGGTIVVRSQVGSGTEFIVELPIADSKISDRSL